MNKISIYFLLILIFLGLSKSFSPSEQGIPYVKNELVFANLFTGAPVSVILVDYFQTGFLIKTYFHKYKIIRSFRAPVYKVVRTSKKFFQNNLNNLGMSLYRQKEREPYPNTIPMPAGTLYVGNPAYGHWIFRDSGEKVWKFHLAYKNFPKVLGWGNFRPSYAFYEKSLIHLKEERPFYGLSNEFGTEGSVTKEVFTLNTEDPIIKKSLAEHFKKFVKIQKEKVIKSQRSKEKTKEKSILNTGNKL